MASPKLTRSALRDLLVPLFCALLALWGIAQARMEGTKRADPAHAAHVQLCLPQGQAGGDAPETDHACGDCCLSGASPVLDTRIALPLAHPGASHRPSAASERADGASGIILPWSRGPPARA